MSERDEYCEIAGSGRNDALRLGDGLLDAATDMIADLRAEVAAADRNARFVEKVREITDRTHRNLLYSPQSDESILTDLFGDIKQALREHDESKPVEPVKES